MHPSTESLSKRIFFAPLLLLLISSSYRLEDERCSTLGFGFIIPAHAGAHFNHAGHETTRKYRHSQTRKHEMVHSLFADFLAYSGSALSEQSSVGGRKGGVHQTESYLLSQAVGPRRLLPEFSFEGNAEEYWKQAVVTHQARSSSSSLTSNVTDALALLAVKSALTGGDASKLRNFNMSLHPNVCDWGDEVKCSSLGRVTELRLGYINLPGTIPAQIGVLDNLRVLDLTTTGVRGKIPAEIGDLTALRTLVLSVNNLIGPIPEELSQLSNLRRLDLTLNFFDGTSLPSSLSLLKNLHYLGVGSSSLGGQIPSKLSTMSSLRILDLTNNSIFGPIPSSLGSISSLSQLRLGSNNLTGTIPSSLGQLYNLEVLDLGENNFDAGSEIPSTFANLTMLKEVYLNYTNLGGSLPILFAKNLPNLRVLYLNDNLFSGSIPPEYSFCQVYELYLKGNNLTGLIPPLTNMTNIEVLDLSSNPLSGPLPLSLVSLRNTLKNLNISNTQISGPIPSEYGHLLIERDGHCRSYYGNTYCDPVSNTLDLSSNSLNGSIPTEFGNLYVTFLLLNNNSLTGSLPSSFASLDMIQDLDVSDNLFTGELPSNLFEKWKIVESIALSRNNFSGALPTSLCATSDNLDTVLVDNNQFSGPIPKHLATCPALVSLDMHQNKFNGTFPASLGHLPLVFLDLSSNNLSGTVPPFYNGKNVNAAVDLITVSLANNKFSGNLPPFNSTHWPLSFFNVSNNELEGALPPSLTQLSPTLNVLGLAGNKFTGGLDVLTRLPGLAVADVADNQLEGTIPPNITNCNFLQELLLGGNKLTGTIPESLSTLTNLQVLNLSYNSLDSAIPTSLGLLPSLTFLDLRHNKLTNTIPANLGNATMLEGLDLSENHLTGDIPVSLASLRLLTFLNLSDNELSGTIPGGNLTRFSATSFEGNLASLCGSPLTACPAPVAPPSSSKLATAAIVGIACASVALVLLIIAGVIWIFCGKSPAKDPDDGVFTLYQKLEAPFTLEDVIEATNNFSDEFLLGRGGFGSVFRCYLKRSNVEMAIKRLDQASTQGLREVRAEMDILGSLKHRNLVVLYGSYISATESLLFYEFLPNGDLDDMLEKKKKKDLFSSWRMRHNALVGSARGLKYLHHDAPRNIIHRDIKPPNILFDEDLEPRVADFGLARDVGIETHMQTGVAGTVGYLAPEYARQGILSLRSDVFAFGIVLFQVITGRRPGAACMAEQGMARWVPQTWKAGGLKAVLDPNMVLQDGDLAMITGALRVGILCTSRTPSMRPSMDEVVHFLESLDSFETIGETPRKGMDAEKKAAKEALLSMAAEDDECEVPMNAFSQPQ
eukprot:TRINITY_DN6201_c0_g1_i1.p1 TRINITY_DN6201_c0_g1~~TRINITY_DN6201_c0_g1_i1.p1  ORF type:complete len:1333 (+),score=204.16 TRINITY_DN6201_c0_g1_i1:466-4464(+)